MSRMSRWIADTLRQAPAARKTRSSFRPNSRVTSDTRACLEPLEGRVLMSVVPVGTPLQVNTYTTGSQGPTGSPFGGQRAVAADAQGDFAVVWEDVGPNNTAGLDGSYEGVFCRLFWADGTPRTPQFQVNTYTRDGQIRPSVAMDRAGDFVVVWESQNSSGYPEDGSGSGVYAKRFDPSGNVKPTPYASTGAGNGEFRVNTYTKNDQFSPSVAMDDSGNFTVAWSSLQENGGNGGEGIYAKRYDANGYARPTPYASTGAGGGEFHVNTYTSGIQHFPSVASDAAGDTVIVWEDNGQDGSWWGVYGQRLDPAGNKAGTEFRVNQTTAGAQWQPSASCDVSGNFTVTWTSSTYLNNTDPRTVYGRRYTSVGVPLTNEFPVSTVTGVNSRPQVSLDRGGAAVFTWLGPKSDGTIGSVSYARLYDALGNPDGGAFNTPGLVNHTAWQPGGQLVAVFTSNSNTGPSDGDSWGMFCQRYAPPLTAGIAHVTPTAGSSVDTVRITFSRQVSSGFGLEDLSLSLNGGPDLLSGSGATLVEVDATTWELRNLGSLTTASGSYVVKLTAAGSNILDSLGLSLSADAQDGWNQP